MRNSNGLAGFGFRSWTGGSASSCASWDSAVSTYVPRASSFARNSGNRVSGTHPSTTKLWSLTANRSGASALSTSTSRASSAETTNAAYRSRRVSRRPSISSRRLAHFSRSATAPLRSSFGSPSPDGTSICVNPPFPRIGSTRSTEDFGTKTARTPEAWNSSTGIPSRSASDTSLVIRPTRTPTESYPRYASRGKPMSAKGRNSSIRWSRSLRRAVAFFRASSSSVMFSSSVRIFSRISSIRTASSAFGGAFNARMFAIDRSLTRFSESSAAGGSGLPIRNVSSSPWWSTMWMSFISCKVSMTAASFSRGPATTARAIGSGLSTHRTPELFQDQLHRTIDVPAAATRHPSGLLAGLGEQPLPFLRDGPLGRGEDLSVSVLAFLAGLVDQVERLATGGTQHLFAFALRGLLHRPNLGLRFFDSLERFRFAHIRMGRRTDVLLKCFRSIDTSFAGEHPRARKTFSYRDFYRLAIMLLGPRSRDFGRRDFTRFLGRKR